MKIPTETEMMISFLKPVVDEIGLERATKAFEASKPIADEITALVERCQNDRQLASDTFVILDSLVALFRMTEKIVDSPSVLDADNIE